MRYLALASDYDGTLATHGTVSAETVVALERWQQSGRKLILVTGRELEDLMGIFPHINLFDRIVLENGALLYHPATGEEKLLGDRPPEKFIKPLNEKNVNPLTDA
ncbi:MULTISPECIES: HAD-IIB family hydrolase [Oscillatoriales]|uniref:HAD family hydrolase n=1 Tax=Oscillatoriophycideae TaxID=1301283 RepID=UPI001F557EA5|nr:MULTISPECIES: HAD-IIB family hydrolase [Oscillatoriales]